MDDFSTFRDLIALWPSRAAFAEDVSVSLGRVHKWAQKNSIPAPYLSIILTAGKNRRFDISADLLLRLSSSGLERKVLCPNLEGISQHLKRNEVSSG
ncbi:hypothetical protein AB9F26_05075 [Falsihalocynthiibacter sp. BN13B15]|uniref:hypothetical protein n=1 Tax=Falsihalocynthiibacter sp. BN13B15 TaxID=3240871 RepID=UPI00350EB6D7